MRIDWDDKVAGVPMLKVRDILKKIRGGITKQRLSELIGSSSNVSVFISELRHRGWIENNHFGLIDTTIDGNAVMQAKKLPVLTRVKAEGLLKQVLSAVDNINSDENYAHDVKSLAVFGSFLSDSATLSDLDIAYELKPRGNDATFARARERCLQAFPPPRSADFLLRLGWPEIIVLKKLTVSNRVSLERLSAVRELGFPYLMLKGEDEEGKE